MTIAIIDLERAKLDPGSVFRVPGDVVSSEVLSPDDKAAILLRWEADAAALLRANDEGMQPSDDRSAAELLAAVRQAAASLGANKGMRA